MPLKNLTGWFKSYFWDIFFILILLAVSLFVAFQNYTPGTWLLGWDSLLPELNLKLNIARSLSAVWQEYQGLGLLGGMAHAADLPRQMILWFSSLFIPTSFLRYFWTFLMLCLGPLGVYFMLSRVILGKNPGFVGKVAGFASAVFYLFNLATLQIFYTPFETFVSFYGFFPWLLYFAARYLSRERGCPLFIYAIVSVIGACAFYVQTLFVVYVLFLSIFALETVVKHGKEGILRSIKLFLVTFFVNAFWLLPALYFTLTSAAIPVNSHINSIATPETQLMNAARAGLTNIATLKGYWFDYYDFGQGQKYDYLYKTWIDYTRGPSVVSTSLALFFVSASGLAFSLLKKKTSYGFSFLVIFGISYFMLNGGTVPGIPFFPEIFRNAFTKWSNAAAFVYSIGLGLFVYVISDLVKSKLKYFLGTLLSLCIVGASVFSAWPITKGELIAKSMKLTMPVYYLDTINYFKDQGPTKRIVDFPLTDFWGWKFTDWGYRGSGFLWYGIPQPMLDRSFDVWSPYNEGFYTEISHAVEAASSDELKYVLGKYEVSYILFDGSIFEPGNSDSDAILQKQKDFLESSGFISKAKEFGKITIYRVNLEAISSNISAPKSDFTSPFVVMGQGSVAPVVSETFSDDQGYKEAKNCDLKEKGSVAKKKINGGNYYAAYDGGISCDYFYYPALDYSQAYQMRIKGKNISGRPLKFYLYNSGSKNVDREELLPTGDFDKSYLVLPTESSPSANLGYTLNVETRSFGKIKSENLLTKVEFYQVDYDYFSTFKGGSLQGVNSIQNNLKVLDVQKFGTWAYKVETAGSGLIELGQGYEPGWVAFEARDFPSNIFHLPFLEHVKVNSWANGFLVKIDPNQFQPARTVYLVFWPQLLEWGGGLLGLTWLAFSLYYICIRK